MSDRRASGASASQAREEPRRPLRFAVTRRLPELLVMDNGPASRSHELDVWATQRGVPLHIIRPGRPMENAFIESFSGTFRDECLNTHWFIDLT